MISDIKRQDGVKDEKRDSEARNILRERKSSKNREIVFGGYNLEKRENN